MKYASNNIRNILIAGHAGSGKTTLTEALVYFSGAAERMGRVEDGTTISDFDPEEAKRKASLSASVVPVEYEGIKYNLIDAPGLFDFEAGEYEGIRAAESVLVCVSGRSGVTVGAEKAFQLARKNGKATMVFVSKCDLENANYFKILEDMKIKFGSTVCPCVVPAKLDDGTPVYINLFSQKAFKYEGGKQVQVDLPDIGHRFQGLIEAMSEAIAETDEALFEKYCEGEELSVAELKAALRKATINNLLVPVVCGTSYKNKGVQKLLDAIIDYMPAPIDIPAIKGINPDTEEEDVRHASDEEPFAALAFKIMTDPFVGKLCFFRVYSGTIEAGSTAYNPEKRSRERFGRILQMHANERKDIDKVYAGDIAAIIGTKTTTTGDTLCDESHPIILEQMVFPEPVISVAIEPKTKAGQEKMGIALSKLAEEDPTFRTYTNEETGQTIIAGMGELHLEIIVDRLLREFKVEANVGAPQVSYKETIRKEATTDMKYARQSGGKGQYGHVKITISPNEPGKGYEFINSVVGGAIPKEYIPAVDAGIQGAMQTGVVAGYNVVDVKVNLFDGSYHEVDSSEMAFKIAGSMAFKDAMKKADPVLTEPIMKVVVVTPDDYMGDVIGDLNSRRGQIQGFEARSGAQQIDAFVPLAEMFGYATDLRSRTQGRGQYTMEPSHYIEIPKSIQEKIIDQRTGRHMS